MTVAVEGRAEDHLVGKRFRIEFDDGQPDSEFAVSITGLQSEARYAERRSGIDPNPKFDLVDNAFGEVTITFTQSSLNNAFTRWHQDVLAGTPSSRRRRTINVIPLSSTGVESAYMVKLSGCSPRTLTPGDFDATTQDSLVGTLVVQPEEVEMNAPNPIFV